MNSDHHQCVLVRHGETEWSLSRRHTGRSDLPLLPEGVVQAEALAPVLGRLAGLGEPVIDPDLAEWDYGRFEGLTTDEIRHEWPGWDLFRHGAPEGEDAAAVGARADRVIARVRAIDGQVACVAHGHLLRVLAVRWAGLEASAARSLLLFPAALGILGWDRDQPAIEQWNLGGEPVR
jgi:broad specificity phosphatase PhoE